MIQLVAKSQVDGIYYFSQDKKVYVLNPPLDISEAIYVDNIDIFFLKSIEKNITLEEKSFENIDEFRKFVINDCDPKSRGIIIRKIDPADDFLEYAAVEIVQSYFGIIDNKIKNRNFSGLKKLFLQLSKNQEIINDMSLACKLDNLMVLWDNARFPNVQNAEQAGRSAKRIAEDGSVLSVAA